MKMERVAKRGAVPKDVMRVMVRSYARAAEVFADEFVNHASGESGE